jgi:hypothetical protein
MSPVAKIASEERELETTPPAQTPAGTPGSRESIAGGAGPFEGPQDQ